jgi:anti-anti-sigma regulatory factor
MDAITRIIKSIIVMALVGLGLLLASNIVRGQWTIAIIDVAAAGAFVGLYYILDRWSQLLQIVGALMAALMIVAPFFTFLVDPENMSAAMPILAIGGVMVLSLLWPGVGLLMVGLETASLALLTLLSEHISIHSAASFAAVSIAINMVSRWLSEALERAERAQSETEAKNAQLGRALANLEETVELQRQQVETIRTLQVPLIESERGIGLLVVVGHCDVGRVSSIQEDLFDKLHRRSFHRLVVDVSGASFGGEGLDAFVHVLQALRLMISEVVVSGMSPELARTLTDSRERMRNLRRTVRFSHSLREAFTSQTSQV